jgi:signal transduction histidine kinase
LLRNLFPRRWPFGSGAAAGSSPTTPATDPNVEARLRQQGALVYLSRRAQRGPDASHLLADVCRVAARVLRADVAHVLELLPDGRTLVALAASGWPPEQVARWQMDIAPESRLARALLGGTLLLAGGAGSGGEEDAGTDVLDAVHMRGGLVSVVRDGGTPRGLLGIYTAVPRRFTRDELQFVRALGPIVEATFEREAHVASARLARRHSAAAQADVLRVIVGRLRPALRASVGHLWTFRDQRPDAFTLRRAVRDSERQVASVAEFIEDLWLLADLLEGCVRERRAVTVAPMLASLADQLSFRAASAGITLVFTGGDDPIVMGDPALIRRAVLNVLDNALRATPAGGAVTVTTMTDKASLRIDVTDTGRGMTPAQVDRLNTGVERPASEDDAPVRIGWRLAAAIAEAHGGTLSAASDGPGLGSRITLRMPSAEPNPQV